MINKNNTNEVLSGLIKSSERQNAYDSNVDNDEENDIINQNQNNIILTEEEPENEENESDGFVDFNALNANNFSEEEEDEQNEDLVNQNLSENEDIKGSANQPAAYNGKNSLRYQEKKQEEEEANLSNNSQEQQKDDEEENKQENNKMQKTQTNKTNTNRTMDENNNHNYTNKSNKNTQRQNKHNINNLSIKNQKEEQQVEEEDEDAKAKKAEILSFLLNSDIKSKAVQKEESLERKQKIIEQSYTKSKKYQHIESNYKKAKLEKDPTYKAGPAKFFITIDSENPEFGADKQNALRKLMLSNKNANESEKEKIIRKLLFQDIDKQEKIIKVDKITNTEIKNKVSYYLNKKQKKIDEIESLCDEIAMKDCTFKPEFVSEKLFPEKRQFKVFLEDQNNHIKRVNDKLEKIKEGVEKELEKEIKPLEKINHELYNPMLFGGEAANKSRNKSDEKAYIRLYNLRNQKEKNNLLKAEYLTSNNKINTNQINNNNKTNTKRKTVQERDMYLQNLYKKGLNLMEKIESERFKKQKQQNNQMQSIKNPAWIENNKFFLEKTMHIFRNAMKHLENKQDRNLYEIDEENKFKEEEIVNEKSSFDKKELKKFLFDFGFTLFDYSQDGDKGVVTFAVNESQNENNTNELNNQSINNNDNGNNNNTNTNNNDNVACNENKIGKDKKEKEKIDLKAEEKKLVNTFVESVFQAYGQDNKLGANDLFLYVIGIINLYDYFIYSSYKKTNPIYFVTKVKNNQNKALKLAKSEKEIALKNQIIQEIKEEINNKIQRKTRYASFDKDNQLRITDENANNLKRDFHMFYLNFMFKHNTKHNKEIVKAEVENQFKQKATFKPKIDVNSKKLYSDYRRKILITDSSKPAAYGAVVTKTKEINDYIDGLILRKKKKENEQALLLEQKKKEELKDCTFQPLLETNYISKRRQGESVNDRENRFDNLYNIGKQLIRNKKNKTKKDIENEEIKLCSFRPDTSKPQVKNSQDSKILNDIHNEKNYELLYKRLKEGRLERYIRELVHDRGEFPEEFNVYKNKNIENVSKINLTNNHNNTVNIINKTKSFEKPANTSEGKINTSGFNSSLNNIPSEENEIFNNDPDKKDAIPLLIIDVNIRPGVKKKIYVYDGDTSEALAERFSKEHELDNETKNKLQGLIQSHMSKLLMRIPEENQSVSEKSSTYNLT